MQDPIHEAYGHGKSLDRCGAGKKVLWGPSDIVGGDIGLLLVGLGAGEEAGQVLKLLQSLGRFPQREASGDVASICPG